MSGYSCTFIQVSLVFVRCMSVSDKDQTDLDESTASSSEIAAACMILQKTDSTDKTNKTFKQTDEDNIKTSTSFDISHINTRSCCDIHGNSTVKTKDENPTDFYKNNGSSSAIVLYYKRWIKTLTRHLTKAIDHLTRTISKLIQMLIFLISILL